MADTVTPGPALQCFECDGVTPVDQDTADAVLDDPEAEEACMYCMSFNTAVVDVIACPDPGTCHDDQHHHGLGVHVSEPQL